MDQNNDQPQQPAAQAAQPVTQVQVVTAPTAAPVKLTLFEKVIGFFRYLFGEGRIILFLIAAGVLVAEFGNQMMSSILKKDKKLVDKSNAENDELKAKEDAANQQADALVQDASSLPGQQQPVTDDWYKNGKQ